MILSPLHYVHYNLSFILYLMAMYNSAAKIKKIKKIVTIGLAYSFQKVKEIPVKKHDIRLDFIVTNKED